MSENNLQIEQYLETLNEEQRLAVEHEGSPLLILAGAGSGKTRVITTKIAYLISRKNVDPWSILSVTFTKKAANEMKERAVKLESRAADSQIRTFHSFGSWFLRRFYEAAGLESSFTIYDDDDMATIVRKAVPSLSQKEAKIAVHQISLAKDNCLTPEDDLGFLGSEFDINQIYYDYQKRLKATGNADFGDLIMLPTILLDSDSQIADFIHNRFKVIMVDEYQDSNIAQYRLLQKISGLQNGNDSYVCVVGDDDQSIYRFRGAEVQNILSFPQKFPGTQIIRLEKNYRSTSQILKAAEVVVNKNQDRLGKKLVSQRGDGGNPVMTFLPDQDSEAIFAGDLITKSLLSSVKGEKGKYSDWAILYRTNAQSLVFEKEFLRRKIPYVVIGSLKFYEREEIRDALSYISLFANQKDEISFRRIINKPTRGIGEKTQDKIMELAVTTDEQGNAVYKNLIETVKQESTKFTKKAQEGINNFVKIFENLNGIFDETKKLSVFVDKIIKDSGLDEYHKAGDEIDGTTRVQNLSELVNSAVAYPCTKEGLLEFLDAINLDRTLSIENEKNSDDAVTLITLHNTKGLEYKKVIITGLEEGIFPWQSKTGAELEEERRLFYVGITRAKDELYVTSAAKRCVYGGWKMMTPSPFLQEAASAFTIKGQVPFGFGKNPAKTAGVFFDEGFDDSLTKKWKVGTKIFHDDYGYGYVISEKSSGSELIIEVSFENGGKKRFFPKYQGKNLTIIKD